MLQRPHHAANVAVRDLKRRERERIVGDAAPIGAAEQRDAEIAFAESERAATRQTTHEGFTEVGGAGRCQVPSSSREHVAGKSVDP